MPFIFKGLVDTLGETSQAAAAAAVATGEAVAGGAPPEAAVAVPFAMVLGYGIARSTASGAQEVNYERWGCRDAGRVGSVGAVVSQRVQTRVNPSETYWTCRTQLTL